MLPQQRVFAALVGFTLLVVLMIAERLMFQSSIDGLHERIDGISHLSEMAKRADERIVQGSTSGHPLGNFSGNTLLPRSLTSSLDEKIKSEAQSRAYLYGVTAFIAAVWMIFLWFGFAKVVVSSRRELAREQKQMDQLVSIDKATGLLNREAFMYQAKDMVKAASKDGASVVIVMIDLDHFKPVNDAYGPEMGDKVLLSVGETISKAFRGDDIVARYAGDEFIVALKYNHDRVDLLKRAQTLIARLSDPMKFDDTTVVIGASIGIAEYPENCNGLDDLIRKADIALYHAKDIGRGTAQCFSPALAENLNKTFQKKKTISDAIDNDEIVPFFQPIINLQTGEIAHFEILARWDHPARRLLLPADFLPQVIQFDLANKMTLKLINDVCTTLKKLPELNSFAVNVSAKQIQDDWFVERLLSALEVHGYPTEKLIVEIEESVLITDLEQARSTIISLNEHDIRVMLDDFGTGYSSLGYLAALPFDALKIDKSFVMNMLKRDEMRKVVGSIISLGNSFNIDIVGEGIEEVAHAQMLADLGCKYGQGFYFSKPVRGSELPGLLENLSKQSPLITQFEKAV